MGIAEAACGSAGATAIVPRCAAHAETMAITQRAREAINEAARVQELIGALGIAGRGQVVDERGALALADFVAERARDVGPLVLTVARAHCAHSGR